MAENGRCRMGGISTIVAMITPGVAMRVARGRQQQAKCPSDCQVFVVICLFSCQRRNPSTAHHASSCQLMPAAHAERERLRGSFLDGVSQVASQVPNSKGCLAVPGG